MKELTAEELIHAYGLARHPEGGYFRENYRASGLATAAEPAGLLPGPRNFSTAIYFLLPAGNRSRLHRIKSDEVWHFYLGAPLTIAQLMSDGGIVSTVLGADIKAGQKLQHVVPAGCWFGAHHTGAAGFSFVGCTVAPGFDFKDFELGCRAELSKQFPAAKELIAKLTD
ncbi:MAG TPA: cupin domain-containing protein [Elusimicrobiales bacterium]|nr:cupin domain-containing protein [Elusimicrobiales bacterium]